MSFGAGGGSSSIAGSTDVSLSNPATDEYLGYDATTSKWENKGLTGKAALATTGGMETMWSNYSAKDDVTLDLANGNLFRLTLSGNTTLSFTGAVNDMVCACTLHVKQNPSGGWTITWPANVVWVGGVVPAVTSTGGAYDIYVFETITGGTTWFGSVVGQDYK